MSLRRACLSAGLITISLSLGAALASAEPNVIEEGNWEIVKIATPTAPSPAPAVPAASTPTIAAPVVSQPAAPAPSISTAAAAIPPVSTQAVVGLSTPTFSTAALTGLPGLSTAPAAGQEADITAGPWVIGDVSVVGLQNVKPRAANSQIQAKVGQVYHRSEVNRDIQALLGMGNFDRVTVDVSALPGTQVPEALAATVVSTNTVRLTFQVHERPTVKKIKFEGNKELGTSTVSEDLTVKEGDPFDDFKAKQDAAKILDKYHDKGFAEATVTYRTEASTATMSVDVTFQIFEGLKTHVVAVEIIGAKSFKQKKIAGQMDNSPGWFFKTSYKPSKLPDDMTEIEKFYKNHGYLDIKVVDSTVTFNSDRSEATVHVTINEGRQYFFGTTSFDGYTLFTREELKKTIQYHEGAVFENDRFTETIGAIQEMYANKGRLKARVTPTKTLNPQTDHMDISLKIEEGPIVKIGHVDVEGNHATKTYVLKRELTTKSGDTFSAAAVRRSQQKLMNLGFLDNVDIDMQPSPEDPNTVDLTYTVLEGKPGMLTAGAGLSSLEGLVGTLSLSHLNLFGKAQRLTLTWQFGARVQNYQISWTEPWIGTHPWSLGIDLFDTNQLRPFETTYSAFTDQRKGGSIRLGPRFADDKYHVDMNYTYQVVTATNVASQFAGEFPSGPTYTSSFGINFYRDTRDNIWDPTTGSKNGVGITVAGGPFFGGENYYKPTITDAINFHMFSVGDYPHVLTLANRFGLISQFGSTSIVPIFDRFFIGGQDTLRGYSVNGQVGPPDGGNIYDVANIEWKFPIAMEHRHSIVAWVFFVDVGGSWKSFNAINPEIGAQTNDFKTDVGMGIRFTTPAFPIRLDWGYGLNHEPGESKFQVNFGLGNLF